MRITRALIGLAGLAACGQGVRELLSMQWSDLLDVALWLAGGVLLHDGVLAPLVVVVGVVAARVLPDAWRRPVAVVFVVLGSVTVAAIPVLGGWGRRPDNATLLDRDYAAGWWAVAAVVLAGTLVWHASTRRAGRRHPTGRHPTGQHTTGQHTMGQED